MTEFQTLGLAEPVLRAVTHEGYSTPTPIQEQGIPPLLEGRDLMGIAQTGTGKTAAFVLPILDRISREPMKVTPKSCGALILAPTRELAAQIVDSIKSYGRFTHPSVTLIVGGVNPRPQIQALAGGVDIVVATPGRLLDHMNTGVFKLDALRTIVLDEADQMMDLGFLPGIRRIMNKAPADRQTVLFSATMPKQIKALASDFLNDPVHVAVAVESRPIDRITQTVEHMPSGKKKDRLLEVLSAQDIDRAIVFTRTKRGADKVCKHLADFGLEAQAIHGNKSQGQRTRALDLFKKKQVRILVATDIAARGIDIDDVTHVVNFELPNIPEAYVHRIGRTARAGKSGIAIAFCDGSERAYLRDIEKTIRMQINAVGEPEPETTPAASQQKQRQPRNSGRPQNRTPRHNNDTLGEGGKARPSRGQKPTGRRTPKSDDRPARSATRREDAPRKSANKPFDRDAAYARLAGEQGETTRRADSKPRRSNEPASKKPGAKQGGKPQAARGNNSAAKPQPRRRTKPNQNRSAAR